MIQGPAVKDFSPHTVPRLCHACSLQSSRRDMCLWEPRPLVPVTRLITTTTTIITPCLITTPPPDSAPGHVT
jgi:hypothetical protein